MFSYSPIDRQGHVRVDTARIQKLWQSEKSQTLIWRDGQFVMHDSEPMFYSFPQLRGFGELLKEPVYLGRQQDKHLFACRLESTSELIDEQQYMSLRSASRIVSERHLGLMFYSQGVLNWLLNHPFCSRCGSETAVINAGHARQCNNAECAKILYPKIDPAVIFSIINHNSSEPKILLGRQKAWEKHRYSVVAGFVEPGESLEDAVRREAMEETGLATHNVTYIASQAWPFPDSLMMGFSCETSQHSIRLIDQELESADWFSAREIESDIRAGDLKLPFEVSISHHLIDRWFVEQTGYSLHSI